VLDRSLARSLVRSFARSLVRSFARSLVLPPPNPPLPHTPPFSRRPFLALRGAPFSSLFHFPPFHPRPPPPSNLPVLLPSVLHSSRVSSQARRILPVFPTSTHPPTVFIFRYSFVSSFSSVTPAYVHLYVHLDLLPLLPSPTHDGPSPRPSVRRFLLAFFLSRSPT